MRSVGARKARGRALVATLVGLAGALAVAGCGIGSSASEPRQVSLLVTADYGARPVGGPQRNVEVSGPATAADLLRRERVRGPWSLFVNGLQLDHPAARTRLHRGDVVWLDRHPPGSRYPVRAVVGAFPEPFLHGQDGERVPARLECAARAQRACGIAAAALRVAGTGVVGRASLGTVPGNATMVVLVGLWRDLRADFAAQQLELGPGRSGVYARVAPDGRSIALLDARGRVARVARRGTGLVAATRFQDDEPTWIVTGTDAAGLRDAAAALSADALHGAFAIALDDDVPARLPLAAP